MNNIKNVSLAQRVTQTGGCAYVGDKLQALLRVKHEVRAPCVFAGAVSKGDTAVRSGLSSILSSC